MVVPKGLCLWNGADKAARCWFHRQGYSKIVVGGGEVPI
jgi:hypothetical protein